MSISPPITSDISSWLLQNDKDVFMESLICRLDDNCEKLLICKLDLDCKKTLHFDSEISKSKVSICNFTALHFPCLYTFLKNAWNLVYFIALYSASYSLHFCLLGILSCGKFEVCFDINRLQHVICCYKIDVVLKGFWNVDVLI